MKKTLLVTVLAVALVLSFASAAMARPNGNIYVQWTTAGANGAVPTPHTGYTTATDKCAVCHSVHYAATTGSAWTDPANPWTAATTGNTEMLLRSSVANACNYCHIDTTIGGVQLYGGVATNYATNNSFAHNSSSAPCTGCHAVHGAGTFQGANQAKILRVRSDRPIQAEVLNSTLPSTSTIVPLYADQAAAVASTDKYTQQIAFCTQCHKEYTSSPDATIQATYYGTYGGNGYFKGHAMVAASTNFSATNAGGVVRASDSGLGAAPTTGTANGASAIGAAVAFSGSNTCRQCHDAGGTNQTGTTFSSFPHYTYGYYRFMTSGANGSTDASSSSQTGAIDGNCLKCHTNTGGTAGVGVTF